MTYDAKNGVNAKGLHFYEMLNPCQAPTGVPMLFFQLHVDYLFKNMISFLSWCAYLLVIIFFFVAANLCLASACSYLS